MQPSKSCWIRLIGAIWRASGNPKCADCMVHCGYEPTAAMDAMQPKNIARSLTTVFGRG